MEKLCSNKAVGMITSLRDKKDKFLLIKRTGAEMFSIVTGHVDNDPDFETAAKRELKEEVGLEVVEMALKIEGKYASPCTRKEGAEHYWRIYRVMASGRVSCDEQEIEGYFWATWDNIAELIEKTDRKEKFGLDPIWCRFFRYLCFLHAPLI